jgi:hypothetical protein
LLILDKTIRTRFVINNEFIYSCDPKEILKETFSSAPDISYWSADAMREFITGTFEMIREYGDQIKQELKDSGSELYGDVSRRYSKFGSWTSKTLKFLPRDREKLIHFIFNTLMVCEGIGLLAGFGMSNKHKDKIPGNPERTTICPLPADIPTKEELL